MAALVAGAQIVGGIAAPGIRRLFGRRTSGLIATTALSVVALALIGLIDHFWVVVGLIAVWGLLFAASMPIRQAYLNGLIPSRQRATILSFDSMMASTGGVWTQPALGRAADVWGYATSYVIGAGISALALPFLALSRRENAPGGPDGRRSRARGGGGGRAGGGRASGHGRAASLRADDGRARRAVGRAPGMPGAYVVTLRPS